MKSMSHIAPLFNVIVDSANNTLSGFAAGRSFRCFNYCAKATPELSWDINADFPFDPKRSPKIKDRKIRKASYQSFARYKASFKSRPELKPDLKIIVDEWGKPLSKVARKFRDAVDAILYAFASISIRSKQDFEKQYMCSWDLAAEDPRNES